MNCFLAIDFDGTIAKFDVTDAVLEQFAPPEWLEVEKLWETGVIGSKECLRKQMALINTPLAEVLEFVETIEIDPSFLSFVKQMQHQQVPLAIISDGFRIFIDAILAKNGLVGLKIFANELTEISGKLITDYPYSVAQCSSGTCKCMTSQQAAQGLPVYLIGDGRSDFCLAGAADFVYAKAHLVDYCQQREIPYCVYTDFEDILHDLRKQLPRKSVIA
jgi:2-hydroxy-3-keto-5-methylthiopentenyl-1-phosphate phosphatase